MSRKTRRNQPNPPPGAQPPASSLVRAARASAERQWGPVIISTLALIAVFAVGSLMFRSKGTEPGQAAVDVNSTALASEHSPTLGDATAKVHVVEFLDPACETCAQFYPIVKQLLAQNPGRIRLSLRHVAFHDGSDYVVRLLEASRKQDKYWQTLEALLASQSRWAPNHTVQPELVMPAIVHVGVDMERLLADMNAPDVAERVGQDLDDAVALKVTATPEYFVNGRPLPSFGQQQLLDLVNEELRRNY